MWKRKGFFEEKEKRIRDFSKTLMRLFFGI